MVLLNTHSFRTRTLRGAAALMGLLPIPEDQALDPLDQGLRVLNVAAHPDDEDASLVTYFTTRLKAQTFILYTTRGEGGQNAIGRELYEALGIVREQEIAAATKVYGAQPFFLGFPDFGYCKRSAEAFERWGGETEVVRRMTYALRRLQPHRVFTNHDGVSGHGHHQATALALHQALNAAADPARFPEQLAEPGITAWRVDALFERVPFRSPAADSPIAPDRPRTGELLFDFDLAASGEESVARRAWRGFQWHASQGPWPEFQPGSPHRGRYRTVLLAEGIPDVEHLPEHRRGLSAPSRPDWMAWLEHVKERGELWDSECFRERCARALGLVPTTTLSESVVARGSIVHIDVAFDDKAIDLEDDAIDVELRGPAQVLLKTLHVNPLRRWFAVKVDDAARITWPFAQHAYDEFDPDQRRQFHVVVQLQLPNGPVDLLPIRLDLHVAPAVDARVEPEIALWRRDRVRHPARIEIVLESFDAGPQPLEMTFDRSVLLCTEPLSSLPEGDVESSLNVELNRGEPLRIQTAILPTLKALADSNGDFRQQLQVRRAPNEGFQIPFTIRPVDLDGAEDLRVGFVPGDDRTIGLVLSGLGVDVTTLEPSDLAGAELARFTNLVFDARVIEDPNVPASASRLAQFMQDGGHLLFLYQRTEWNRAADQGGVPAPFPLKVTSRRVCEEDAKVSFLLPEHVLLHRPHRLTDADFAGWVQERGLYFPHESYDLRYEAPLACSDQGEAPLPGGLLFARSGKGSFTYCSFGLHRQLRDAHVGALRILLNLLAGPRGSP